MNDNDRRVLAVELRTQRVTDVARAYGLKPSVVRAIEDGLNYKEVKAAE